MKAHTSRLSVDRACNSVLRRKRALRTHELNVTHYFPRGMPRGKGVTYASHSPSTQALEHTTLHSLTPPLPRHRLGAHFACEGSTRDTES